MRNNVIIINYINEIPNVANCDNIRFVAIVTTSWHLDNALAYVNLKGYGNNGFLVILSELMDKIQFRINENQISAVRKLFRNVFFCIHRSPQYEIGNLLKNLFSKKTNFIDIICNAYNPSLRVLSVFAKHNIGFQYTIADEGLSIYIPRNRAEKNNKYFDSELMRKWSLVKMNVASTLSKLFYISTLSDMRFYQSNEGLLTPNKPICSALANLYRSRVNRNVLIKQPTVILFKDFDVVSESDSLSIIKQIIPLIANNYHLIIKKHPRDLNVDFDRIVMEMNNFKYPINIIQNKRSGEELMVEYHPDFIIGGYTTAIFSSSFIFNVKAISYSLLYLTLSSCYQKDIILFFYNQFKNKICFVNNIEEIGENI